MPNPDVPLAVGKTLPQVGYTVDQLKDWILRQLGSPVFAVELDVQQILDCIQDALTQTSTYRPKKLYGAVKLISNQTIYPMPSLAGTQGVVKVDFVDNIPSPTEIFYGNLISPAPLIRTGLDEYDSFLRWRSTWQRVTSVMPDWLYDPYPNILYIHNPIERYHAGVLAYGNHDTTESLPYWEAQWVKNYALARARYMYGDILSKFSGAIPGPIKDIQLDTGKRAEGEKQMEKLLENLRLSQEFTPLSID
jgi:hypothetical protein